MYIFTLPEKIVTFLEKNRNVLSSVDRGFLCVWYLVKKPSAEWGGLCDISLLAADILRML
jgi:hypothetical protein